MTEKKGNRKTWLELCILTLPFFLKSLPLVQVSFKSHQYLYNFNEENKTFKFEKRHVSATPVPSSVCGWNNNDVQYIAEN